jgi:hypothetical protein
MLPRNAVNRLALTRSLAQSIGEGVNDGQAQNRLALRLLRASYDNRRRTSCPQRLVLLYFNRRPEDTAFLGELQHLEQQNKNFRMLGQ